MNDYTIHAAPSELLTTDQWVKWIGKVYGYEADYIDSLKENECFPPSKSQCVLAMVKALRNAQANQTKTIICGDYDADGVCATTILVLLMDALGIPYGYYIPNRFTEGYGLNIERIDQAYEKGYRLIITVDNGIVAYDAIEHAKELGMDVIVTDHHTRGEPLDVLTVHPDLMEPVFHGLCGAGVAYEVSRHFVNDIRMDILAMVASIADMMVLSNENRRIVLHGLTMLNEKGWINITALLDSKPPYSSQDIAFGLVPKINALGRMETTNANQWIPYFRLEDPLKIQGTVNKINMVNTMRKSLVRQASSDVKVCCDNAIHMVISDTLSPGLIGLVASNLVNTIHKPVIVCSLRDELVKASARSIEGIDLYHILKPYSAMMCSFGGHAQALGFSLEKEKFDTFVRSIGSIERLDIQPYTVPLFAVAPIQIDTNLMKALKLLEPFDKTHPQPLFTLNKPTVESVVLLKNTYPKFNTGYPFEALSFKITDVAKLMHYPWIFTLNEHTFRLKTTIQARIEDVLIV